MPLYDYQCGTVGCGQHFEMVLPVADCDVPQKCPVCNRKSRKIITLGHGGIYRTGDSLEWVRDAAKVLTDGDRPNPNINTVQDLRNFYRANPNIRPTESHPAFPSSYGDAFSRPDPKEESRKRNKAGEELVRKMRTIEVSGRATSVTPG